MIQCLRRARTSPSRATLLCFVGSILFLTKLCLTPAHAVEADAKLPNVVMILADDFGYGDASCYGAKRVKTPNIDRLAREGRMFMDAHSPHSVCTPTRYSLLTGRYCWRTWAQSRGVWSNDPLLIDVDRLTLPKLLKQHGYRTACIGKWHLGFGSPESPGWDDEKGPDYNRALRPGPLELGFGYFFGVPHVGQQPHIYIRGHHVVGLDQQDPLRIHLDKRHVGRRSFYQRFQFAPAHRFTGGEAALYRHEDLAIRLTEEATSWISSQKSDAPFFLYFAHRNVHSPLRPNDRFKETSTIGTYGDFIRELDWSVGEILQALDETKLSQNTLVLFSSDNGAVAEGHQPAKFVNYRGHRANGILRGQKTEVFEGGHRVPLIARWPDQVKASTRASHLVALTDILATMAELLGAQLPREAGEDSISFLHALLDREAELPVRSALIFDSNQGMMSIRQNRWKLINGQGGGGLGWTSTETDDSLPRQQLYNLHDDVREQDNVVTQHPAVVAQLNELLRSAMQSGRSRELFSTKE